MTFLPYIIGLLTFGCIFILIDQYFAYRKKQTFIKERIALTKKKETTKAFALKPLFAPLAPVNAKIGSASLRENIKQRLDASGSGLTVNEFFVFKELLALIAPLVLGLMLGWDKLMLNPVFIAVACAAGFFYPDFWVNSSIQKRRKQILRALPNVIDLLILAVDAGLDFMIAVRKVVERSKPGPMVDEFSQLYHEVQMGRVRRDALKTMAKRLNIAEVHSFTRTLIQAERMGTPMGEALRTLSEEIRVRQFQRGEQQALKAPIKMLFPLLFCILPVVLILVGGPVILQFLQSGTQFFK